MANRLTSDAAPTKKRGAQKKKNTESNNENVTAHEAAFMLELLVNRGVNINSRELPSFNLLIEKLGEIVRADHRAS